MSLYKITFLVFFGLVSLLIQGNDAGNIPDTVKNLGGEASDFDADPSDIGDKKSDFPNLDSAFPSTFDNPGQKFTDQAQDEVKNLKPKNKNDVVEGSEHETSESEKVVNGVVVSDDKEEEDTENDNGKVSQNSEKSFL